MHITDNFMKVRVTSTMANNMGPNGYAQMYFESYQEIEKEVENQIERMHYAEQRKNEGEPSLQSFIK